MNRRRLFSKMAQIVILILLIVLAVFLIRGFARGELNQKKRVYSWKINDTPVIMEKWKEIRISTPYAENVNNDYQDLTSDVRT
jgi:hypothetical protein